MEETVKQIADIVQTHNLIDKEIDKQLNVVIHDTSESSVVIMRLMETLNIANQNIGNYISNANNQIESGDESIKSLFSMISSSQQDIAEQVAEILGSIQYQDIVRQRIERIQNAMQRRDEMFQQFVTELESSGDNFAKDFASRMNNILNDYLEEEAHHSTSLNSSDDENAPPKFELF